MIPRHGPIFPQTLTIGFSGAAGNPFLPNQVGTALTVKFTGNYADP